MDSTVIVSASVALGVVGVCAWAVVRLGRRGSVRGAVKGPLGVEMNLGAEPARAGVELRGIRAGRDVVAGAEDGGGLRATNVEAGRDVQLSAKEKDLS